MPSTLPQPSQIKSSAADRQNSGPGVGVYALPSFDSNLTTPGRFIIANTIGDIEMILLDGSALIWTVTEVGIQPWSFKRVNSANTTILLADLVVGL